MLPRKHAPLLCCVHEVVMVEFMGEYGSGRSRLKPYYFLLTSPVSLAGQPSRILPILLSPLIPCRHEWQSRLPPVAFEC